MPFEFEINDNFSICTQSAGISGAHSIGIFDSTEPFLATDKASAAGFINELGIVLNVARFSAMLSSLQSRAVTVE
jgi:hypothetical protein